MDTSERTARHRLSVVGPGPAPGTDGPDPGTDGPAPLPRPRGWRERWLPASWRRARTDPGRRGALALAAVAAVAAVLAAVGVWRDRPVPQVAAALPVVAALPAVGTTAAPGSSSAATAPVRLVVSVAGAVAEPGLVTLPGGSRVADALRAAGGALPGTDLLTLNLAQPLTDGEQVLVGVEGAPVSGGGAVSGGGTVSGGGAVSSGGAAGGSPSAAGGLVDLNTATAAELEALPGVGPVMAQAIVDFRTENGGFTSVDELDDVSGVGEARFAQLKDLVRV